MSPFPVSLIKNVAVNMRYGLLANHDAPPGIRSPLGCWLHLTRCRKKGAASFLGRGCRIRLGSLSHPEGPRFLTAPQRITQSQSGVYYLLNWCGADTPQYAPLNKSGWIWPHRVAADFITYRL